MTTTIKTNVSKMVNNIDWAEIYQIFHLTVVSLAYIFVAAIIFFCLGETVPALRQALPNFFIITDNILETFNKITSIGVSLFMR